MDTFRIMSYGEMDMISMDPVDPIGAYTLVELLGDLAPEAIDTLVEVAGAGSNSPLIILELRLLGGALSRPPPTLAPSVAAAPNS